MKAVVFDYGGVISCLPEDSVWEEIASLGCIDVAALHTFAGQLRGEYDRGTFSCEEYYRKVLKCAGVPPESLPPARIIEMAAFDEKAWSHINPDTVRLMEDVKKAGYRLGILSNMAQRFLSQIRAEYPSVFSMPDLSVFSCELRLIKPEKAIYEALLERLKCEAPDVVFFDDVPINVEKARDLGIKAYVWRTAEAARATLRDLGVMV
ncbi:MAG: HAD family phosphatase [Treponema sp.]|jgi:putative hydrolase of the HAD superfamily|nr:HAD family phosphatase [Treponema sp.]